MTLTYNVWVPISSNIYLQVLTNRLFRSRCGLEMLRENMHEHVANPLFWAFGRVIILTTRDSNWNTQVSQVHFFTRYCKITIYKFYNMNSHDTYAFRQYHICLNPPPPALPTHPPLSRNTYSQCWWFDVSNSGQPTIQSTIRIVCLLLWLRSKYVVHPTKHALCLGFASCTWVLLNFACISKTTSVTPNSNKTTYNNNMCIYPYVNCTSWL